MLRRAQLVAGLLGQEADHEVDVLRLRVQPGAHRRGADVLLGEALGRPEDARAGPPHGEGVRRELLTETDGHGVLHVGPARLQDLVEDPRALGEGIAQLVQ